MGILTDHVKAPTVLTFGKVKEIGENGVGKIKIAEPPSTGPPVNQW